jgi:hypothetical protein
MALCSLVEEYWRFRDAYSLHLQGDRPDEDRTRLRNFSLLPFNVVNAISTDQFES